MAIYKYTLMKYAKAYSTWIITGLSMFMVIVLGGYLPWHYFKPEKLTASIDYGVISVALVAGITSFLAIFTSVFAGFKSASMFKDEVEDGTFLVMLSKPITRSRIIFFKWLALQTAIAIYTLIVGISFIIAIAGFDKGNKVAGLESLGISTLRSKAVLISAALWGILFVVSLIFSSIALLLSTRLSVGTTIGISIALGVIIPITSLVGTFTAKQAYYNNNTNNAVTVDNALNNEEFRQAMAAAGIQSFEKLSDPVNTLYSLGVETKEHDAFKFAQIFDLNYQIQTLSQHASDQAIPDSIKGMLSGSSAGQRQMTVTNSEVRKDNTFVDSEKEAQVAEFNKLTIQSWQKTEAPRIGIMTFLMPEIVKMTGPMKITVGTETEQVDATNFIPSADIQIGTTDFKKAWSNAMHPYADWVAKGNTIEVQKEFHKSYAFVSKVATQIIKNASLWTNVHNYGSMKHLASFLEILADPLGFWLTDSHFKKLSEDNYSNEMTTSFEQSRLDSLGVLAFHVTQTDETLYRDVLSAVDNGFKLVKINTVDYASKWTVLWVYLILALGLVPVSYFVVRKQDFR